MTHEKALWARWKARTDLFWLAREVLGFKDITEHTHRPVIDHLQKFPAPQNEQQAREHDQIELERGAIKPIKYSPLVPDPYDLPGPRRRLILDPRGFFKTSINSVAHTIQWLLNYPNISILIVHNILDVASLILGEIRDHFRNNDYLRALFPEYVPHQRIEDWGTKSRVVVEARSKIRREPSVGIASIDHSVTGQHYDVIKFSDIVDQTNVTSEKMIDFICQRFALYHNILVRPDSWIDVEGTRYHFNDLYGRIIDQEMKKKPEKRTWQIFVRGVYKKDTGGLPYTFGPEELELPDLLDEHGNKVSWFPERFPVNQLEALRRDPAYGEWQFCCQQLNSPVDTDDENRAFPMKYFRTITAEELAHVNINSITVTVDTAETTASYSNYSVITVCGWDRIGRCYVLDIRRGKWYSDRLIQELISVYTDRRYFPYIECIYVEETSYTRGLRPALEFAQQREGILLPIKMIPRKRNVSKEERIEKTLRPWYVQGYIRFLDTLVEKGAVIRELNQFPRGSMDILDTLADQFLERDFLYIPNREEIDEFVSVPVGNPIAEILDPADLFEDQVRQAWLQTRKDTGGV